MHGVLEASYNVVTDKIVILSMSESPSRTCGANKKQTRKYGGRKPGISCIIVYVSGSERYDRHGPSHDSRCPLGTPKSELHGRGGIDHQRTVTRMRLSSVIITFVDKFVGFSTPSFHLNTNSLTRFDDRRLLTTSSSPPFPVFAVVSVG